MGDGRLRCLLIDDPRRRFAERCGLADRLLRNGALLAEQWRGEDYDILQQEFQAAKRGGNSAAILAFGEGCCAALALSEHLPVERLALVSLSEEEHACSGRRAARLRSFALRNLAFCVSDVLLVSDGERAARRQRKLREGLVNACVRQLVYRGDCAKALCTKCENSLERAICAHLRGEELAKPLAENPEMCIIY